MSTHKSRTVVGVLGIVCLSCLSAQATTYYIDYVGGNDANTGTSTGIPWQHCPGDPNATGNAGAAAPPGDTLLFKGGVTYAFSTSVADNIAAKASGTSGSPITYQSGHKYSTPWPNATDRAVIDGANSDLVYQTRAGVIDLVHYQYITVDGLEMKNIPATVSGGSVGLIAWSSGNTGLAGHILINDCVLHHTNASCIYVSGNYYTGGTGSEITIQNCNMYDSWGHLLLLRWGLSNIYILKNTFDYPGSDPYGQGNVGADCITLANSTIAGVIQSGIVISGNDIAYSTTTPTKSHILLGSPQSGLLIDSNYFHGKPKTSSIDVIYTLTNCTFRNNVFHVYPTAYEGILRFSSDQSVGIDCDGVNMFNNTFVSTAQYGAIIYLDKGACPDNIMFSHVNIENNIIDNDGGGGNITQLITISENKAGTGPVVNLPTFVCDYNAYNAANNPNSAFYCWSNGYKTFAAWKTLWAGLGYSVDTHSTSGAASFVNRAGADYHLQSTDTVALNKGTDLTSVGVTTDKDGIARPQPAGGAFDIGAYEYDGANDSSNSITDFQVQNGMTERSFVRYVTLTFTTATGVQDLINYNRIQLTKYALDGSGGTSVSLAGLMTANGAEIDIDFGALGLGGSPNTTAGDGYYDLALDLDANGTFETHRHFYRLLGDIDGDGVVTTSDANLILAAFGHTGQNVNEDANGDGAVNAADRTYTLRCLGHQLAAGLVVDN